MTNCDKCKLSIPKEECYFQWKIYPRKERIEAYPIDYGMCKSCRGKLPKDLIDNDPETFLFMSRFAESPPGKLLEVGSQHAPLASYLASQGFEVHGVDLRDRDQQDNYTHYKNDFCRMPVEFIKEHWASFDIVVSISAIEHFGLGTYAEDTEADVVNLAYDVHAMRYIWDLLKDGGVAYISVPFAGRYVVNGKHWRTYDLIALLQRLCNSFVVDDITAMICENFLAGDVEMSVGGEFDICKIDLFTRAEPFVSAVVRMTKQLTKRG